jgi:hypothetical protein
MVRKKTGEELLDSINDGTTAEEFELLFTHLSNHISGFRAEQNLSDEQLGRLLDRVWEAIHFKIDSSRNPVQLRARLEEALQNMPKTGGPLSIN